MNLNGTEKSAILLMTLGEKCAAKVFKYFSFSEIEKLSCTMTTMTSIKQLSHQKLLDILGKFAEDVEMHAAMSFDASDYLRSALTIALGEEQATNILEDILGSHETSSCIETLNFMEPQSAADLIRDEHPQIIATILIYLKRCQAAAILALLDDRMRDEVMLRITTFGGVKPAALEELTDVLNKLLNSRNLKRNKMGGVRTAAEIINLMKTQHGKAVIEAMNKYDSELAQKIIDEMLLFTNLVDLDDRSMQRLLQEVENESLLVALKGAEPPLREKFLNNMSQRAAEILRDNIANRGPVRMSQVENEQKAILQIVRRLADGGEIILGGGEDTHV
jgi:flagellar motor switch protein FliG